MAGRLIGPWNRALDNAGAPMAGALANTYQTDTLVPLATYQDPGLTVPHTNPVEADAFGWFPEMFADRETVFRIVVTDAAGAVEIYDQSDIEPLGAGDAAGQPVSGKTANYGVDYQADADAWLRATGSNSWTLTLPDAADVINGWRFRFSNDGTGDITILAQGSTLVDGLTSYVSYPYETRDIVFDGTNFFSVVVRPFHKLFTTSGQVAWPPGYPEYHLEACGAGGGGGSGARSATLTRGAGLGGGGGARRFRTLRAAEITYGATATVTVGSGGTGGAAKSSDGFGDAGTSGGSSSIGAFLTANGGAGGTSPAGPTTPGGAGGQWTTTGASPETSGIASTAILYGGGAGGGYPTTGAVGNAGGVSFFGGCGGGCGGSQSSGGGPDAPGTPAAGSAGGSPLSTAATGGGGAGGAAGATGVPGTAASTPGAGGGGGGSATGSGQNAGAGGVGAAPGGGGGGGGGTWNGSSGAGGDGGRGEAVVRGLL